MEPTRVPVAKGELARGSAMTSGPLFSCAQGKGANVPFGTRCCRPHLHPWRGLLSATSQTSQWKDA